MQTLPRIHTLPQCSASTSCTRSSGTGSGPHTGLAWGLSPAQPALAYLSMAGGLWGFMHPDIAEGGEGLAQAVRQRLRIYAEAERTRCCFSATAGLGTG